MKHKQWLAALWLILGALGCGEDAPQDEVAPITGCVDVFDCPDGFYCTADILDPNARGECFPAESDTSNDQCTEESDCRRGMVCRNGRCVPEDTDPDREDPVPDPGGDLNPVPDPDPDPEPDPEPDPGLCTGGADCEAFEECCDDGQCRDRGMCGADVDPDPDPEPGLCTGGADCEVFEECCDDGQCRERGSCDGDPTPPGNNGNGGGDASQCQQACQHFLNCTSLLFCVVPLTDLATCTTLCMQDPGFTEVLGSDCSDVNDSTCDVDGVDLICLTCPPATNVGGACTSNFDCDVAFLSPFCIPADDPDTGEDTGWAGGYCTGSNCFSDSDCGRGSTCVQTASQTFCLRECEASGTCRPGYVCRPLGDDGVCFPACDADDDCADGQTCSTDTGLCQ